MQSFPLAIIEGIDLDDMGKQELSNRVERLTGRVTALENASPAKDHGPNGMGATFYMSLISLIVTVIGVPIMFLSWIEPHLQNDLKNDVKIEVTEQLKEPLKDLRGIALDVAEIKGQLKDLSPLLQQIRLKRLHEAENLSPKQLSEQLPELKRLATVARTENLTAKPETVEKVGKKLLEVGSAAAWDTALDFLNYKSFLNASLSVAVNNVMGSETLATEYHINSPLGSTPARFSVAGAVPREQAALFLEIGKLDPNRSTPLGNDWILATGGNVILDNMQMKKVIFRDVHILYSGGPLQMQDVYFINCIFDVRQQSNGERLVATILEPAPAVNFKAS